MEPTTVQPQGKIKRGWALTKSAWQVLKLDKEITAMPIIGMLISAVALAPFAVLGFLNTKLVTGADGVETFTFDMGYWAIPFWFSVYLIIGFLANFFAAAIAHAVIQRFQGGDPTIKGSLRAMWQRKGSIAAYSVLTTTVGYILSVLEQRVPFAGKIAVWLVNAAWAVATFFAIPIIATSDEPVRPLNAVRRSVQTIKKVWGESAVSQITIGLIAALFVIPSVVLLAAFSSIVFANVGVGLGIITAVLSFFVLMALTLVFSVLGSIAKSAVYYYAVTGESPETFNRQLLQAAMTPKKARKIFG